MSVSDTDIGHQGADFRPQVAEFGPRTALVTGATSGIGRATARALVADGYRVFGTSRKPERDELDGFELLALEVADAKSVKACLDEVWRRTGDRLDVLVNNVGTGILGAAEESSLDQIQKLFEINLFGAMRMTSGVLPVMRRRQSGRILFLSSAGGVVSIPYASYYCATKHALEAYAEALRLEVEKFGIGVSLIAPGTVSTPAGDKAMQPDRPLAEYAAVREQVTASFVQAIRDGMDPKLVADAILDALRARHPRARYTVGLESWGTSVLKSLAPTSVLEAGLRRITGE
jgi:NAD(P)-dependent dehydrogenase (short-subunit alcohol dehydrogenase family)